MLRQIRSLRVVLLIIALFVLAVFLVVFFLYPAEWTGLAEFGDRASAGYVRQKTLWDWLELLIVPSTLLGAAVLFDRFSRNREASRQEDRYREQTLQKYFDDIAKLLLDTETRDPAVVIRVCTARTVTVLRRLDANRVQEVIDFLRATESINGTVSTAILKGADMEGIELAGADLSGFDLEKTNLSRADLSGATLIGVNLTDAILSGATLNGADLTLANLSYADMSGAHLRGATLTDTTVTGTYLAGADLTDAVVSGVDLTAASVDNSTLMPGGRAQKAASS